MSVKVLVADDHEVVRRGLASLLSGTDIKIVAEAKSGDEAVKLTKKAQTRCGFAGHSHARLRWIGSPGKNSP